MSNVTSPITTTEIHNDFPQWLHGTLYFMIGILAIGGNTLNLAVLPKLTNYPESAKYFMSVLACSDLMTGVIVLVDFSSTFVNRWLLGDATCKLMGFGFFFFGGASSSVLLLMNIDRFFAISRPFLHQRYMTNRNILILCGVVLGIWFVFIQLCVTIDTLFDNITYDLVYRICITQLQQLQGVYPTLLSICLYAQGVVLVVIYVQIWRVSRGHSRRINAAIPSVISGPADGDQNGSNSRRDRNSDTKAIRTTLMVTGVFIVSYTPYSTSVLTQLAGVAVPPHIDAVTVLIAICNTWWNTVVYTVYNRSFREKIIRLFLK